MLQMVGDAASLGEGWGTVADNVAIYTYGSQINNSIEENRFTNSFAHVQ